MTTAGTRLSRLWNLLTPLPGGRWLFSRLLGVIVPYSGSIRANVLELEPHRAVVSIRERRRLRNHLRSVHAIALANLAELASGLAMTMALPPETKSIAVRLDTEYLKKARGTLTATGHADPPSDIREDVESIATAEIRDEDGDVVACMRAHWRLRPHDHTHHPVQ